MGNGAGTRSTLARMSARRHGASGGNPVEVTPSGQAHLERTFGHAVRDEQIAGMAGALPGERVTANGMTISAHAADGSRHFITVYRSGGEVTLGNGGHDIPGAPSIVSSTDPTRLGAQVRAARSLGVESIFVKSSDDASSYRLAQMGFDRELRAIVPHETKGARLPDALARVTTLQGLMRTAEGQAWVRDHLHTAGLYFDVRPGSASMRAFGQFRRRPGP
jgi:hypothetical protein